MGKMCVSPAVHANAQYVLRYLPKLHMPNTVLWHSESDRYYGTLRLIPRNLNLPFASSNMGAVIWGSSCCCCCCRASATLAAAEAADTRTDRVESPIAVHNTAMLLQTSAQQQRQSRLDAEHADIQPRPQTLCHTSHSRLLLP